MLNLSINLFSHPLNGLISTPWSKKKILLFPIMKTFFKKIRYQVHFLIFFYIVSYSPSPSNWQKSSDCFAASCMKCFTSLQYQGCNPSFKLWVLICISSSGFPEPKQMNCGLIEMIRSLDPLCSLKWCNLNHFNLKAGTSQKL